MNMTVMTLSHITYANVVSRDSVITMFLLTALNSIDVLAPTIVGAYLNAPHKDKVHITAGPELFVI